MNKTKKDDKIKNYYVMGFVKPRPPTLLGNRKYSLQTNGDYMGEGIYQADAKEC